VLQNGIERILAGVPCACRTSGTAAGGALGLIIAWWTGRALAAFGTGVVPIPVSFNVSLDATVLMFAVGASFATAILFGVAPAWSASKLELVPALKASMEGIHGGA
jgi:ABC-type lipoprotein release transport system permease subunit